MRLYEYREVFEECSEKLTLSAKQEQIGNNNYHRILNWTEIFKSLNTLRAFDFFQADFKKVISHGLQFNSDEPNPTILSTRFTAFQNEIDYIRKKSEGIAAFIDSFYESIPDYKHYVYVELPDVLGFDELEYISKTIDSIINQCPVLEECKGAKIVGVEKGSSFIEWVLANPVNIVIALQMFGGFILLCSKVYKNFGEGYLAFQKGRRERLDRDKLNEKVKHKEKGLDEYTLKIIEDVMKEDEVDEYRKAVLAEYKKIEQFSKIELGEEEIGRLVNCVKDMSKLFEKGVNFYPSEKAEEKVIKAFPKHIKKTYQMNETKKLENSVEDSQDNKGEKKD